MNRRAFGKIMALFGLAPLWKGEREVARIGDVFARWAQGDRLNHAEIEQVRRSMNIIQQRTAQIGGIMDDLGNVSSAAIDVPVAQLFSKTLSANSTGVSVKFAGSKYGMAMISGSVLWDQAATGVAGVDADLLLLRINNNTSTSAYEYFVDEAFGTTGSPVSTAFGFSTVGAGVLTAWPPSSYSDAAIPNTFLGFFHGANTKFQKTGRVFYDYYGVWSDPGSRLTANLTLWFKSTGPINSFDFSLARSTDVADAASGYMLPGSYFSAWGFK